MANWVLCSERLPPTKDECPVRVQRSPGNPATRLGVGWYRIGSWDWVILGPPAFHTGSVVAWLDDVPEFKGE